MMHRFVQYFLFTSLFASQLFAFGESGFLIKGKKYVVYRDGMQVGKTFAEHFPKEEKGTSRTIASKAAGEEQILSLIHI